MLAAPAPRQALVVGQRHQPRVVFAARVLVRERDLLLADLDGPSGASSSSGGLQTKDLVREAAAGYVGVLTPKHGAEEGERTSASSWTFASPSILMK